MSTWTSPVTIEIKMDAEIGSYQPDDSDRGDDFCFTTRLAEGEGGLVSSSVHGDV